MRYTFLAIIILGLAACEKNKLAQKVEDSPSGTYLKIGYFAQYSTYTNANAQLKVDNQRITGVFTSPTPYPGGGFNTGGNSFADYLSVEPGTREMRISFPNTGTEVDSVVIYNKQTNITADARQTLMITDTGANVAGTMLIDDLTPPQTAGTARAKFFNGMPGSTLDFYIRTSTGVITPVAKAVPYKSVTSYFDFPVGSYNDTLEIVTAGATYPTTTPLAKYGWTSTNIIAGRVYTILAAGFSNVLYTAMVPLNGTNVVDNRRARVSVVLNK